MFAGVQDDRFLQLRAEAFFKLAEAAEVFGADPGACLDLDGDYLAVVAFEHEVDFITGFGAEVPGGDRCIGPAGLRGRSAIPLSIFRISRKKFPCLRQLGAAVPKARSSLLLQWCGPGRTSGSVSWL